MMLAIYGILDPAEARVLRDASLDLPFEDGAATAGRFARTLKANHQASATPERDALLSRVERALAANSLFRSAARPRALTPLILSLYRPGQTHGLHVDDALMGACGPTCPLPSSCRSPTAMTGVRS